LKALLASLPLALVLTLMLWRRWSTTRAGLAGVAAALLVGSAAFGLTWRVLWISQVRGFFLAFYVLYIIWPALLLYHLTRCMGGIAGLGEWLSARSADRSVAALLLAWPLSSLLEGIAGFGVPLAVVSPMIVAIGFDPVTAVAATAVGHAWSVTFGDMGVVFEALVAVVHWDARALVPAAALLLGLAAVASGVAVARILRTEHRWLRILAIGAVMALAQAGLALAGLRPLAALGAGAAGLVAGVGLLGSRHSKSAVDRRRLATGLLPYGLTTLLLAPLSFWPALAARLSHLQARVLLPEVATSAGWVTAAGAAKAVPWLTHPGSAILLSFAVSWLVFGLVGKAGRDTAAESVRSAASMAVPVSLGILAMMSLATIMDHCGMTQELARALSGAVGRAYPLLSAFVGLLGAFTTGSNTNSNVLFGPLQLQTAHLLHLDAVWLLAAQTAGGALGSMVAPAKLVVGCAAVGIAGQDGRVLRRTAPYALALLLLLGGLTLLLA